MTQCASRLMHSLRVLALRIAQHSGSEFSGMVPSMKSSLVVGLSLLLIAPVDCRPASANSVAEFSRDFVRGLVAALLL